MQFQAVRDTRARWHELPDTVRHAVESEAGTVRAVEPVSAGLNSGIAALLCTSVGRVFVKGMRTDRPGVAAQHREAEINPHVTPIAPRLLWQIDIDGWNILGFEHLKGRHASLAPDSPDLPKIAETLACLGEIEAPDLPLKRLEDRWAGLADDSALVLLAGDYLLHTDLNPHNILIGATARIVDWAWPTRGAGWIDAACAALWLIAEGHTPAAAERWAQQIEAYAAASPRGIDTFTTVSCRLWKQIAHDDPQPWKRRLQVAAQVWAEHRLTPANVTAIV